MDNNMTAAANAENKRPDNTARLETRFVGDIRGNFVIPSYQRGYRWGVSEVTRLLDDIYENGAKNYCLQPVVVCRRGVVYEGKKRTIRLRSVHQPERVRNITAMVCRERPAKYELIDGQQRLTTLYLIYKYMGVKPDFSLEYDIRDRSGEFLEKICEKNDEDAKECIDFWFMYQAYQTITKWFEKKKKVTNNIEEVFKVYLEEKVSVIWYEVKAKGNEDNISLFTRLNIGRIPLTNGELVKALFLCSGSRVGISQGEIALQWDQMEQGLQDNSFWYFLTNADKGAEYQTRIDLVLDLVAGDQGNNRDKYATFFYFDKKARESNASLDDIWNEIYSTYLTLKDWYEDHNMYHKIGYLVAVDAVSIKKIYKGIYKNKGIERSKSEFIKALDKKIKDDAKNCLKKKDIDELSYYESEDKKSINKLLLLFNVESVRKLPDMTQRFPFDLYKTGRRQRGVTYSDADREAVRQQRGKGSSKWTLEHIHAQNDVGLEEEYRDEWLYVHKKWFKKKKMDNALKVMADEKSYKDFGEFQLSVLNVCTEGGDWLNSIGNLALLDLGNNSELSNAAFDEKRDKIIEMDKEGAYIPYCTKMAFLKYYTPSEYNQQHFWGAADSMAYLDKIKEVLKDYLSEDKSSNGEG